MGAIPDNAVPHDKAITLRTNDMEAGYPLRRHHRPAVVALLFFVSNILCSKSGLVVRARDEGEPLALFDGFEGAGAALVPEIECATG